MPPNNEDAGKVLFVLLLIAAFIAFLFWLSKFLLVIAIVSFAIGIILLVFEIYSGEIKISPFLIGGAIILFILSALIGQFATSLAGTAVGQASLQTADAINQAENSINQAYQDIIDEQCKIMAPEQCEMLRVYAKTAKSIQELESYASKIKQIKAISDGT